MVTMVGCSSVTTTHTVRDISPDEVQFIKGTTAVCLGCGNAITAINNTVRRKCLKTLTVAEMTDIETHSQLYRFVVATTSLDSPMTRAARAAINGMNCLNYDEGLYKTALPIYKQTIQYRERNELRQQQVDLWLQSVMRI